MLNYLLNMVRGYQDDFEEPIKMEQILNFIENSDEVPDEAKEHLTLMQGLLELEEAGYLILNEHGWAVPER